MYTYIPKEPKNFVKFIKTVKRNLQSRWIIDTSPCIFGIDPMTCYNYSGYIFCIYKYTIRHTNNKYSMIIDNLNNIDSIYNNFYEETKRLVSIAHRLKHTKAKSKTHIYCTLTYGFDIPIDFIFLDKITRKKVANYCRLIHNIWANRSIIYDNYMIHSMFK